MNVKLEKNVSNSYYDTYSQVVLGTVVKENTLLIHPSSFENDNIIRLLIEFYITSNPDSKIGIILSDTDLFSQYVLKCSKINENKVNLSIITSNDSLEKRKDNYAKSNVFIITPHLLKNDIFRNFLSPTKFSLLIIEDAFLAKGKHAIVKLLEIFHQNNISTRIIGFTPFNFNKIEVVEEVCSNLLITKIEYGLKEKPGYFTKNERIISVPINKPIYDFCFEINRYIREYQTFLKDQGIEKPITLRKEFPSFIMYVRSNFEFDHQQVLIRKAIELINFQTLKDLVESSGIEAAIKYLENLQNKHEKLEGEEDKLNSLHSRFVRAPIFQEFMNELKELSKTTDHPKFDRLIQLITELKEKEESTNFLVVANNKTVEKNLINYLKTENLIIKKLPRSKTKEREKIKTSIQDGKIDVLVTTKYLDIEIDKLIFFNNPTRFSTYVKGKSKSKETYIFLTHRSNEERVYYNFKNREKTADKLLKSQRIKQTLIQNQQIIFKKNMNQRMDTRTRAMVSVAKALSRGRGSSTITITDTKKQRKHSEQLEYIQFLSKCSEDEAELILLHLSENDYSKIESFPLKFFTQIFSKERALEIYGNIKGRKQLVSE
ncbi:MAG: hypothetical protein KAS63_10535 [Candidatus Heimdallarchaeota archaeon]|nr:hypothetical protein [Candidatus Heimdallarchaeota archaeon]MCK4955791.1 hypothetical protein [Candidatus Heimdallarchaeota archaeon]